MIGEHQSSALGFLYLKEKAKLSNTKSGSCDRAQCRSHYIEKNKKIVCLFERLQLITDIPVTFLSHLLPFSTKQFRKIYRQHSLCQSRSAHQSVLVTIPCPFKCLEGTVVSLIFYSVLHCSRSDNAIQNEHPVFTSSSNHRNLHYHSVDSHCLIHRKKAMNSFYVRKLLYHTIAISKHLTAVF